MREKYVQMPWKGIEIIFYVQSEAIGRLCIGEGPQPSCSMVMGEKGRKLIGSHQ